MSFGLYLEYNRYFSCQYNAVYGTYKLINNLQNKQNKNLVTQNIKLEDFMSDVSYDYNMETMILNTIGINGKNDILSLTKVLARKEKNKNKNKHVTSGKYDKQKQIHALLSNIDRCNIIKNATFILDYQWNYALYC